MSLINDALKRASQTAKDRPSQASLPTPMEPVRESAPPKSKFIVAALPLLLVIVALAGWFFWQWFRGRHAPPPHPIMVASPSVPQRPGVAPVGLQPKPLSQARRAGAPGSLGRPAVNAAVSARTTTAALPVSRPSVAGAATPGGAAVHATATPVNPSVAAASTRQVSPTPPLPTSAPRTALVQPANASQPSIPFPTMQVKGIFYNRSHPYALINGDTVTEGEYVLGVRIVKIQPDRVILELNGHTKQLVLGE